MADIVAPTLAGPCLDPDLVAVRRSGDAVRRPGCDACRRCRCRRRGRGGCAAWSRPCSRPYDRSAALLFYGAIGLVAMLLFEWIGSMIVLDQAAADALYGSTKSLATVGPNPAVDDGPKWFKVTIVASMLLTLLSAACFTGGLINRLVDSRLTGLIGRRAVPRRDHVVVVGLGPGRAAAVPAAARVRRAGGGGRHRGRGRERRLRAAGEAAGRDRARREPGRAAAAVAGRAPGRSPRSRRTTCATSRPRWRRARRTPSCASCCGRATARSPTRRASLERIGHVLDVHRLGAAFIAGLALGKDASGGRGPRRPAAAAARRGSWEEFPLEIAR